MTVEESTPELVVKETSVVSLFGRHTENAVYHAYDVIQANMIFTFPRTDERRRLCRRSQNYHIRKYNVTGEKARTAKILMRTYIFLQTNANEGEEEINTQVPEETFVSVPTIASENT